MREKKNSKFCSKEKTVCLAMHSQLGPVKQIMSYKGLIWCELSGSSSALHWSTLGLETQPHPNQISVLVLFLTWAIADKDQGKRL